MFKSAQLASAVAELVRRDELQPQSQTSAQWLYHELDEMQDRSLGGRSLSRSAARRHVNGG